MPNRETLNQRKPELPNPSALAPDDETLLPGELTTDDDGVKDPDQANQIPKVAAEAEAGVEEEDTDEDDDADEEDDDEEEDGEVEEGSGGHV